MSKINIEFEKISIEAVLNNSETADNIKKILPITNSVNIWGDEIYFPVDINDEEIAIELFANNIITAGKQFLDKPNENPLIPNWNRVQNAVPNILDNLLKAVDQDKDL